MQVWLVTPAWGRLDTTRMVLKQRALLAVELAPQGIALRSVVVADDGNLELAEEFGFDALPAPNVLGAKVNAGIKYAKAAGADWIVFAGSDNWLHADLFTNLETRRVVAGRQIAVVDLGRDTLRVLRVGSAVGVPPWFIPAEALNDTPCDPTATRGIEGELRRALLGEEWTFHDPHPLARVDFKSAASMTSYQVVSRMPGCGSEVPAWEALMQVYPEMQA